MAIMTIGRHVSFPDHMANKINSIPKGEVSKICQNAILEHLNARSLTLEEIEAKIRQAQYEKEKAESSIHFLETQKKKILSELEAKQREKEVQTQQEDNKLKQKKKNFLEIGKLKGYTEEALEILYEDYKKDSRGGIVPFFLSLAEEVSK